MGTASFRMSLLAYLADESDWLRQERWPIRAFLKNPDRWESGLTQEPSTPARKPAKVESWGPRRIGTSTPTPETGLVAPPTDFPARWNSLVPERPVDVSALSGLRAPCYSDRTFAERFEEICAKACVLIAAGSDMVTFPAMLKKDFGSGMYGWQRMLAGEWDWVLKKNKPKPPPTPSVSDEEMYRRREERYAARKAAGTLHE